MRSLAMLLVLAIGFPATALAAGDRPASPRRLGQRAAGGYLQGIGAQVSITSPSIGVPLLAAGTILAHTVPGAQHPTLRGTGRTLRHPLKAAKRLVSGPETRIQLIAALAGGAAALSAQTGDPVIRMLADGEVGMGTLAVARELVRPHR